MWSLQRLLEAAASGGFVKNMGYSSREDRAAFSECSTCLIEMLIGLWRDSKITEVGRRQGNGLPSKRTFGKRER